MFLERQIKILGILYKHRNGVTSDEIARLCGVSSKTIRNDIKAIAAELPAEVGIINTSTRHGFSLDIADDKAFADLLKQPQQEVPEGNDRNEFIIKELLKATLTDTPLRQQLLADSLFIGLSTLKLNLKPVKERLEKYELSIISYKNKGMLLDGREQDIRHAFFKELCRDEEDRWTTRQQFPERFDLVRLKEIVIRVTTGYNIILTDDSLERLLDYILIALYRTEKGHNVTYRLQESRQIESRPEFGVSSAIFEEIYNVLKIDVVTNEIYYLAQLLVASKRFQPAPSSDSDIHSLVGHMIDRVRQVAGLDFSDDSSLRDGLVTHLESVLHRIRFHMHIKNEVLDLVKNQYPLAFQLGVIASKVIEEQEKAHVSADEIGFLAIHFGAAMTRKNIRDDSVPRRALLVCGSGIGTAVLLKARVEEKFQGVITVVKTLPGYGLGKEKLEDIDIILSTLSVDHLENLPPQYHDRVVEIKNLLDEDESQEIKDRLFNTSQLSPDTIDRFFNKDYFHIGPNFKTKEEVLEFLTTDLQNKGLMSAEASQSVFERERSAPTEIGNLVAIPHPLRNDTAVSAISVLIMDKPIMWQDHHVQVVFLLSIAKQEYFLWEPVFLRLFQYLVKQNGVKRIIDHPNHSFFLKDFKKTL